jgi:hypothetical protein
MASGAEATLAPELNDFLFSSKEFLIASLK